MSQERQEQFEQSFQDAVKASLHRGRASIDVRSRLQQRLIAESLRAPSDLEEPELAKFERQLRHSVAESQQWAVDESLARRVESSVGNQAGRELHSERSLYGAEQDTPKARYLQALQNSVQTSCQGVNAPVEVRRRTEEAVRSYFSQSIVKEASPSKVVTLPSRSRWKRALTAAATLAAGFALVIGTLVGSAEKVLAESVRQDHQRCCESLKGSAMKSCPPFNSSEFGPLPTTNISARWALVASRMCRTSEGSPMVHNVYLQGDKTISLHFLPPQASSAKPDSQPRKLADGKFPVLAWEASGWTVTACSSDLDMGHLASAVGYTR